MTYFIKRNSYIKGPYKIEKVLEEYQNGDLLSFDRFEEFKTIDHFPEVIDLWKNHFKFSNTKQPRQTKNLGEPNAKNTLAQYYYIKDGKRMGPYLFNELDGKIIYNETLVWSSINPTWKEAKNFIELNSIIKTTPPKTPVGNIPYFLRTKIKNYKTYLINISIFTGVLSTIIIYARFFGEDFYDPNEWRYYNSLETGILARITRPFRGLLSLVLGNKIYISEAEFDNFFLLLGSNLFFSAVCIFGASILIWLYSYIKENRIF